MPLSFEALDYKYATAADPHPGPFLSFTALGFGYAALKLPHSVSSLIYGGKLGQSGAIRRGCAERSGGLRDPAYAREWHVYLPEREFLPV